ncbi:MAG: hypothetical protein M1343_04740 [Chloroflexi bacterium]|nr:hypothetical protein [Chloroflexota bacterium]
MGFIDVLPEATTQSLVLDHVGLFALGGLYLAAAVTPKPKDLLEALGFENIPLARNWTYGSTHPMDGFVLDMTRIGVECWFDAIMSGRRPPVALNRADIERDLQVVLQNWDDSARLADSPLTRTLVPANVESREQRAEALREAVLEALSKAQAGAPPSQKESYCLFL